MSSSRFRVRTGWIVALTSEQKDLLQNPEPVEKESVDLTSSPENALYLGAEFRYVELERPPGIDGFRTGGSAQIGAQNELTAVEL